MNFEDEFAYIFGAAIEDHDLVVRLDMKETIFYESFKNGALQIRVIDCQDIQNAFDFFEKNAGEFIWSYELLEDEKTISLLMDDGTEFKVIGSRVDERVDDLTIEEVDMKMKYLMSAYHRESESSRKGWSKFQRLDQLVRREIENEIGSLESKREFFSGSHDERADQITSSIKLCNRLLNHVQQISVDE